MKNVWLNYTLEQTASRHRCADETGHNRRISKFDDGTLYLHFSLTVTFDACAE